MSTQAQAKTEQGQDHNQDVPFGVTIPFEATEAHCYRCRCILSSRKILERHLKNDICKYYATGNCKEDHVHQVVRANFTSVEDFQDWITEQELDSLFVTKRSYSQNNMNRGAHVHLGCILSARTARPTNKRASRAGLEEALKCKASMFLKKVTICACPEDKVSLTETDCNSYQVVWQLAGCLAHNHEIPTAKLKISRKVKAYIQKLVIEGKCPATIHKMCQENPDIGRMGKDGITRDRIQTIRSMFIKANEEVRDVLVRAAEEEEKRVDPTNPRRRLNWRAKKKLEEQGIDYNEQYTYQANPMANNLPWDKKLPPSRSAMFKGKDGQATHHRYLDQERVYSFQAELDITKLRNTPKAHQWPYGQKKGNTTTVVTSAVPEAPSNPKPMASDHARRIANMYKKIKSFEQFLSSDKFDDNAKNEFLDRACGLVLNIKVPTSNSRVKAEPGSSGPAAKRARVVTTEVDTALENISY